jgi:AcrR family transcriptional regulator
MLVTSRDTYSGPVSQPQRTSDLGIALTTSTLDVVRVIAERRAAKARPIEQTAQRLSESALLLFDARGYDDVTVGDIATHAGVTARTFFRYFPSKETVLLDIFDQTNERLKELLTEVAAGASVFEVLRAAMISWFGELGALLQAMTRLATTSPALNSALLLRSASWEVQLAEALRARFSELNDEASLMWASVLFMLLRLTAFESDGDGQDLAATAERVADRFRDLVSA